MNCFLNQSFPRASTAINSKKSWKVSFTGRKYDLFLTNLILYPLKILLGIRFKYFSKSILSTNVLPLRVVAVIISVFQRFYSVAHVFFIVHMSLYKLFPAFNANLNILRPNETDYRNDGHFTLAFQAIEKDTVYR